MAHEINKNCISCGICENVCPNAAIIVIDGYVVIDPNYCDDCGECSDICPVGAPELHV